MGNMLENAVELVKVSGVIGAVLIIALLTLFASIFTNFMQTKSNNKSAESKRKLADTIDVNFRALNDTLLIMMEHNKMQFKNIIQMNRSNYLSTDLSIDLYRDLAFVHIHKKLKFVKGILEHNDLINREAEIKKNIQSEFRKITNESAERISRYRSVIGDMGKIISELINWDELLEETFQVVFNKRSTKKQKMNDLNKNMDGYVSKIERKLREYGEGNE